jgi:hypothetical protein
MFVSYVLGWFVLVYFRPVINDGTKVMAEILPPEKSYGSHDG